MPRQASIKYNEKGIDYNEFDLYIYIYVCVCRHAQWCAVIVYSSWLGHLRTSLAELRVFLSRIKYGVFLFRICWPLYIYIYNYILCVCVFVCVYKIAISTYILGQIWKTDVQVLHSIWSHVIHQCFFNASTIMYVGFNALTRVLDASHGVATRSWQD